jgi:hypothetical protein
MTGVGKSQGEALVDTLLERITELLEASLELVVSPCREKRLTELAALTRNLARLSAAAARIKARGESEPRLP